MTTAYPWSLAKQREADSGVLFAREWQKTQDALSPGVDAQVTEERHDSGQHFRHNRPRRAGRTDKPANHAGVTPHD